jgi:hypothetical protein
MESNAAAIQYTAVYTTYSSSYTPSKHSIESIYESASHIGNKELFFIHEEQQLHHSQQTITSTEIEHQRATYALPPPSLPLSLLTQSSSLTY